jgi:four helix bundle protein
VTASRGFRDLLVWQKATDIVVAVYRETRAFPAEERYGLTSQLRRAAVSIVANIAEGAGRDTRGEFANCLSVARGSLNELDALLEVSQRLEFLRLEEVAKLTANLEEVGRMLIGLRRSIRRTR